MNRIILILIAPLSIVGLSYRPLQQQNHAPVVKIVTPAGNAIFNAESPLAYQVTVTDQEDGDSKYDEINVKEITLEVRYVKDKIKVAALISKPVGDDPAGLAVIKGSNCFNCHNFSSKSIGPSFFEISKRYPLTAAVTDTLVKRIKSGSAGIWNGKEKMPGHPELSADQIKASVLWILKDAANPDISYYNGTSGIIRLPGNKEGTYILTASYTDHGIKNSSEKHLKGFDRIAIMAK